MRPTNLKMTSDHLGSAMGRLRKLAAGRVLVGVPAEEAFREPDPDEKSQPNNAMLGYIHENGSPAQNIPARPFLIPGVRDARERIASSLESSARKTLAGADGSAEQDLHKVGLIAQAAVRAKITDGPFVPLHPQTLAKRKKKGRTGTKPLIDTGQLRNSINYVVES